MNHPLARPKAMLLRALIVVLPVVLTSPSWAQGYYSGNQLLDFCDGHGQVPTLPTACLSYIAGVTDSLLAVQDGLPPAGGKVCLPDGASLQQVKDVVVRRLRTHPESRRYGAASEIGIALLEAFPCSKNKSR